MVKPSPPTPHPGGRAAPGLPGLDPPHTAHNTRWLRQPAPSHWLGDPQNTSLCANISSSEVYRTAKDLVPEDLEGQWQDACPPQKAQPQFRNIGCIAADGLGGRLGTSDSGGQGNSAKPGWAGVRKRRQQAGKG